MHFTSLEIRVEQDFLASLKPTVKKVQFLRENSNRGKEFFLRNETKIDFSNSMCYRNFWLKSFIVHKIIEE